MLITSHLSAKTKPRHKNQSNVEIIQTDSLPLPSFNLGSVAHAEKHTGESLYHALFEGFFAH